MGGLYTQQGIKNVFTLIVFAGYDMSTTSKPFF